MDGWMDGWMDGCMDGQVELHGNPTLNPKPEVEA